MTNSHAPLDSRIFATQPVAVRALAEELRRSPRASAAMCTPLASTRIGARPPLPGQRHQDGVMHPNREAGTAGVEANTCSPSMTK
ncbi:MULTISPECIES: hypothetical protein [Paeniglutamicibacter]|uniref:Uncharacterized protein n=1 Tax=Paeniglutamicibacter sulfureus TaxID=43666 RepID=A0ABU2BGD5_9MICC|nr:MULTISPECIES: hypothetical protein [Paeniglutamicibacter]MCV9993109.1 hypothetical protein [Paeniglutamicibacter sp. ZC-3]MDO2934043.1 hypothetical protein [Paeniglutamicibacter sulfureus]MDR7357707.1 hypothetical protein [Paeniglutamicibacter sulfureus]